MGENLYITLHLYDGFSGHASISLYEKTTSGEIINSVTVGSNLDPQNTVDTINYYNDLAEKSTNEVDLAFNISAAFLTNLFPTFTNGQFNEAGFPSGQSHFKASGKSSLL